MRCVVFEISIILFLLFINETSKKHVRENGDLLLLGKKETCDRTRQDVTEADIRLPLHLHQCDYEIQVSVLYYPSRRRQVISWRIPNR